jgi:hypothetical protein
MGCDWQALQGAAHALAGAMYWGIICEATGGHIGAQGGGQAVAASGAAYIGAGGQQTGAGGQAAGRLNQLQGQQGHSPLPTGQHAAQPLSVAGMVATASKARIFFIILCLLRKQSLITAWVESSEYPIQTLNGRGISGGQDARIKNSEF